VGQEKSKYVGYESHLTSSGTLMSETPDPVGGCDECVEFAREWAVAMRRRLKSGVRNPAYDPSKATDAIVLMYWHKAEKHGEGA